MIPFTLPNGLRYDAVYHNDDTVTLSRKNYAVRAPVDGLLKWAIDNAYIQDALSELSDDDREFLISGMNPTEFEALFGPDEQ